MHPGTIVLIAFFMPIAFLLLLVAPIYLGVLAGLYLQYGEAMLEHALDPEYVVTVFESLYDFWSQNGDQLGFLDFTLPAFGPAVLGVILGLGLFIYFVRYLRTLFLLHASNT